MRTRCGTRRARMEVAPCLIILKVAKRAPSQKDWSRCCGRLVLGLDAWQQNLGEIVGLEFGRGVGFTVFADQYVLDLAIGVAVAGRKLDKLNGRVHGVGRHGILGAPVDSLGHHVRIDGAAGIDGITVAQVDRAQNRIAVIGRKALALARRDERHNRRIAVAGNDFSRTGIFKSLCT